MWKSTLENMNQVRAQLGDVVTLDAVTERFGKSVARKVRNYATCVSEGTYDLRSVGAAETAAVVNTNTNPEEIVMSANEVISLIPKKDTSYVKWGCYDPVKKVLASRKFAPIYIVGPTGNGKTMGVHQACHDLNREAITVNLTNETTEEHLIGTWSLQDGNTMWKDGPVVTAMRRGAVCVLDEIDQATSKILCLQTIMQNHAYYNPRTGELIKAADGFNIVATANTKGNGEGADRYVGAMPLNEAFLERFNVIVEQQYPTPAVEKKILAKHISDNATVERLIKWANSTRAAFDDGALESCITTRRLVQICQNIEIFGKDTDGVKFAIARFSADDRDSMMTVYEKLKVDPNAEVKEEPAVEEDANEWVDPFLMTLNNPFAGRSVTPKQFMAGKRP